MSIVNNKSHLSPYSKTPTNQDSHPLRTKAFSHTDNLPDHNQEHPTSPTKHSNDRIEQIKRKYDKLFIKSNGKVPDENQGNSRKMVRHSQLQIGSQTYKYSNSNKYSVQASAGKESYYNEPHYDENLKNMNPRQYLKKDHSGPKNTEMKSQIDYNRMTLTNMKSQLQSKLNDVYTKTNNTKPADIDKRHEKSASMTFNSNQKLSTQEAMTYEAIINKYSKSINNTKAVSSTQNGSALSALSKMEPQNYSNYRKKYDGNSNTTLVNSKYNDPAKKYQISKDKTGQRRQLSIISQISNSNNSQVVKENEQTSGKSSNNYTNMARKDMIAGQNTKYNAQSKIIIEKPVDRYTAQRPSSKYARNGSTNNEERYELKETHQQTGFEKQLDRKQYNNYITKDKPNYSQGLSMKDASYKNSSYKESLYKESFKDASYKEPSFNQNYKQSAFHDQVPFFKDSTGYKEIASKYGDKQAKQVKYDDNKWYKNTSSYLQDVQGKKVQEDNQHLQFTLNKLENNQEFTIKRTVTEQYFMNLHKANYVQTRNQSKLNTAGTLMPSKNTPSYEIIAQESQPKDSYPYSKSKYGNHTPNAKETRSASIHEPSKYYNEERSQIQKLKDKYKINSNSKPGIEDNKGQKSPINIYNQQNEARNNQSISKEIQRLDERIKMIQQNKKELNLNFKPYEMSKSNIRSNQANNGVLMNKDNVQRQKVASKEYSKYPQGSTYSNNSTYYNANMHQPATTSSTSSSSTLQNQQKMYTNSTINTEKTRTSIRNQGYLDRVKPMYSQITIPQSCKTNSNPFSIKLMPVQKDDDFERDGDSTSKSRTKDYMNKLQIENRTDYGIEERKKKLQDQVQIKNNLKNLVKSFGQQASLDENFRNNKIWFASERNNTKWQELRKQMQRYGMNLSINELKRQFQLLQSENNPFFSITDHKCDIKSLVNSYIQSKKHWDEKIYRQYDRCQIQKEGFNNGKLDSDRKGYIEIQDFVRFLNIESGTFLRNRDLSIIFRRINQNSQKITYQQLINTVSH